MATGAVIGAAAVTGYLSYQQQKKAQRAQDRQFRQLQQIAGQRPDAEEAKREEQAAQSRAREDAAGLLSGQAGGGQNSTILTSPLGVTGRRDSRARRTILGA